MGTNIRAELSPNNPFYISKHRRYELKHFCLQYSEWEREYNFLSRIESASIIRSNRRSRQVKDTTGDTAAARIFYSERLKMIREVADEVDPVIGKYIFIGVTQDLSYDKVNARYTVPCCKDVYYQMMKEFFWRLSIRRK